MTEQAVTDTANDEAKPSSEDVSELDSLLEEFNEPEPSPEVKKTDVSKSELREFLDGQKTKEENEMRNVSNQGIKESSETLAKSLDLGFSDEKNSKVAKGLLLSAAEDDPRVAKAFANRINNPAMWNKVLDGIAKEFGEGRVDANATGSHDALRQSLSKGGNTTTADDDNGVKLGKKLDAMSDADFAQYKSSLA